MANGSGHSELENLQARLDAVVAAVQNLGDKDEVAKIKLSLAEIQKEVELRRALDTFRQDVYGPFRDEVERKFDKIHWTWTALAAAIPLIAGLLTFLGYLKMESIEETVITRVEQRTNWIPDAAGGLAIGDRSPREAAELLQRAFENPMTDRRWDEAIMGELLHDWDSASMYEEGEEFIRRLRETHGPRYRDIKRSETYNNIGAILIGRALTKHEVLDDAISQLKTAVARAAERKAEWFPTYNLWIAYLMKSEYDPVHAQSHLLNAKQYLDKLYTLPSENRFEWRDWETVKRALWFPLLERELPRAFDVARKMMRPLP